MNKKNKTKNVKKNTRAKTKSDINEFTLRPNEELY